MKVRSKDIRERLGITRSDWAKALGVNEKTVSRWEEEHVEPGGLAHEVMRGIASALEEGANAERVGRLVELGIGSLLFYGLMNQLSRLPRRT